MVLFLSFLFFFEVNDVCMDEERDDNRNVRMYSLLHFFRFFGGGKGKAREHKRCVAVVCL